MKEVGGPEVLPAEEKLADINTELPVSSQVLQE